MGEVGSMWDVRDEDGAREFDAALKLDVDAEERPRTRLKYLSLLRAWDSLSLMTTSSTLMSSWTSRPLS